MKVILKLILVFVAILIVFISNGQSENYQFNRDSILSVMHKVNDYQVRKSWGTNDRNWKRATFYTGVMAFYKSTQDEKLLNQARYWSNVNFWQVGSEWYFPANRFACVQTYLQIYFEENDFSMIRKSRDFMDKSMESEEIAYDRGWYYIDALYVGAPAFIMMSKATNDEKYTRYVNRTFWELANYLYDENEALFYRDHKARINEKSKNGKKVLWSRGNGWVIASLPRIMQYLPDTNPWFNKYKNLLSSMAYSLKDRQRDDGFWNVNLGDPDEYSSPESSGTAFFVYAIAWGINNGILNPDVYDDVVIRAWRALYTAVDEEGNVCWGQHVARGPSRVDKEDSDEYVAGAFLLAGSEILKFIDSHPQQ